MSRVLVTGATGFIGQTLIGALAHKGYALRAALRQRPSRPLGAGIDVFAHGDLAAGVDWQPALDGVDQVIHLAGIAHVGSRIDAGRYDLVNRGATAQLANAAAAAGVRQFIFISSIRAQSGPAADHILTERDQPSPTDAYGRSKLAAEEAVKSSGVPFTILRPVVLYGPNSKANVALLRRVAASPWPLPLQSFTKRRSLLGIDNFVAAIDFILSTPAAIGETYIVADPGDAPRLCDIIAIMRKAQGRRTLLLPLPTRCVEIPLRMIGRADVWNRFGGQLVADPGKLIAAGWRPAHDTATGLTALMRTATLPTTPIA